MRLIINRLFGIAVLIGVTASAGLADPAEILTLKDLEDGAKVQIVSKPLDIAIPAIPGDKRIPVRSVVVRSLVMFCQGKSSDGSIESQCWVVDGVDGGYEVRWQSEPIAGTVDSAISGVRVEKGSTRIFLKVFEGATVANFDVFEVNPDGTVQVIPHAWGEDLAQMNVVDLDKDGIAEVISESGLIPDVYKLKDGKYQKADAEFPELYVDSEAKLSSSIVDTPNIAKEHPVDVVGWEIALAQARIYRRHFDEALAMCDQADLLLNQWHAKQADANDSAIDTGLFDYLNSRILFCRAYALIGKGRQDQAGLVLVDAVKIDPRNHEAADLLASLHQ